MQISKKKSEAWDAMYQKLVEYYKIHGHTDVVREKHHTSIYNWINYQRRCRREQKGKYPKDRIKRMDKLKFSWIGPADQKALAKRETRTAHTRRSARSPEPPPKPPAPKRRSVRSPDPAPPPQPPAPKPTQPRPAVQPEGEVPTKVSTFIGRDHYKQQWDAMYELLKQFYNEHGHTHVTVKNCGDNKSLFYWVGRQRVNRRNEDYGYPPERLAKLAEIEFDWGKDLSRSRAAARVVKKKSSRISRRNKASPTQAVKPKEGRPKKRAIEGRQKKVERPLLHAKNQSPELSDEDKWKKKFEKLKLYQQCYGHCIFSTERSKVGLGKWVLEQRMQFMCGALPKTREFMLDQIGFPWSTSHYDDYQSEEPARKRHKADRHGVGTEVKGFFRGYGWASGAVVSADETGWTVRYEDGDVEEFGPNNKDELDHLVANARASDYDIGTVVVKEIHDRCFIAGEIVLFKGEYYTVQYDGFGQEEFLFGSSELDEMVRLARSMSSKSSR